ncbi:MAG: UDP-N-acetylmuramoyl-L-alanine--D-glutamate ligase [Candidatus Marinimicrobia bacterium]|nr:UDP-N-acetylmuramoyl-L-alanine--D-glutamate ligase [Candidatus Neomarinimicrobiota bacterium]
MTRHEYREFVQNNPVTVLGAQRSGIAAAKLLKKHGCDVFLSDFNEGAIPEDVAAELSALEIPFESGQHSDRVYESSLAVVSPGIPSDAKVIAELSYRNIEMVSEVEVSSWFVDAPLIAITGSNGKTTTTTLIAHFLEGNHYNPVLCGNIGRAFADAVLEEQNSERHTIYVAEVSSFQLERVPTFRPDVALILNITPDHLNRYDSFEDYYQAKFNITSQQTAEDELLLNYDDPILKNEINSDAQVRYFSILPDFTDSDFHWDGTWIRYNGEKFLQYSDCKIRGMHNLANVLSALNSIVRFIPEETEHFFAHMKDVLTWFTGIEHRLEYVDEVNGVTYYNDSKATNVDSVKYAIESFSEPVYLILGGYDKNAVFTDLLPSIQEHVKETIAIGKARTLIQQMLSPAVEVRMIEHLEDAMDYIAGDSSPGDVALLSPACASFDQYQDYEERGNHFKKLVKGLKA